MGFDDQDSDTDITIITELVTTLKNKCSNANLFGIAANGRSPQLDGFLVAMIKIFEEMFGEDFWRQSYPGSLIVISVRVQSNAQLNDFFLSDILNSQPIAAMSDIAMMMQGLECPSHVCAAVVNITKKISDWIGDGIKNAANQGMKQGMKLCFY